MAAARSDPAPPRPLLASGILLADRIGRLIGNTIIVIWVARAYGPAEFGLFSYAQSILVLVTALATLGLPDVVVRELVRRPLVEPLIVRSALLLRLAGALVALVVAVAFALVAEGGPTRAVGLTAILVAMLLFQTSEVFEYRLQARHRVPLIALVRSSAFGIATALKIAVLVLGGPIEWIAVFTTAEALAGAALLAVEARGLRWWRRRRGERGMARRLLAAGAPLFVRSAVIALCLRADQLYVKYMLGAPALGGYAAAARLIDIWFFVPAAAMTAFAPILSRLWLDDRERYYLFLSRLMAALVYAAILAAAIVTVFAPALGPLVFGARYPETPAILAVVVWSVVFGTLGQVTNSWVVNEGATRVALSQAIVACAVALLLYPLLIARFGVMGAAGGVVAVQAIINLATNAFYPRTRHIFRLQLGILTLAPLREAVSRRRRRR